MTDVRQPQDPEGGALLWSVDGTLTIRRTAVGYHIVAETYPATPAPGAAEIPGRIITIDAQQDDIESFIDQLKRLMGSY